GLPLGARQSRRQPASVRAGGPERPLGGLQLPVAGGGRRLGLGERGARGGRGALRLVGRLGAPGPFRGPAGRVRVARPARGRRRRPRGRRPRARRPPRRGGPGRQRRRGAEGREPAGPDLGRQVPVAQPDPRLVVRRRALQRGPDPLDGRRARRLPGGAEAGGRLPDQRLEHGAVLGRRGRERGGRRLSELGRTEAVHRPEETLEPDAIAARELVHGPERRARTAERLDRAARARLAALAQFRRERVARSHELAARNGVEAVERDARATRHRPSPWSTTRPASSAGRAGPAAGAPVARVDGPRSRTRRGLSGPRQGLERPLGQARREGAGSLYPPASTLRSLRTCRTPSTPRASSPARCFTWSLGTAPVRCTTPCSVSTPTLARVPARSRASRALTLAVMDASLQNLRDSSPHARSFVSGHRSRAKLGAFSRVSLLTLSSITTRLSRSSR